jgi:hypothetical protein
MAGVSGDLSWFVRGAAFFRGRFAAVHGAKPKIAIPAAITSFSGEEHYDPLEKVKLSNREMIRSAPRAGHKLKIRHGRR